MELRHRLVEQLVAGGALRTGPVQAAFGTVPRERFVPLLAAAMGLPAVYADEVIVTQQRHGVATSSSSQPSIMALMLEALDVRPGHRVLEVGLGTGYNAALLATLVGPQGAVTSVDIDQTLVTTAARALANGGYRVTTAAGDGRAGWPATAPYDRIAVTAATAELPRAWWDQLAPGGVLVAPVRVGVLQAVVAFTRTGTGFVSTAIIPGGFMPLRDGPDGEVATLPTVTVRAHLPGEPGTELAVSGPGLTLRSGRARRTLIAHLLARPTVRTVGELPVWPLVWYAALGTDRRRHLAVHRGGMGFGLVDPDGGCALLAAPDRRVVVESHGPAAQARTALLEQVRAWRAAGSPGLDRLVIEAGYGPGERLSVRWAADTG